MSHPALADGARFRRRGRLLVAAAAIFWSLGGLMARSVGTDPWTTVFWRGLFCAAFLVAVTAVREGRRTPGVFAGMGGAGIGMAMCFAIGSTCFILALHHTSVANVLIIQSLSPFIAGLLGWIWMGERVAGRTWLAMGVAMLGTAVMVSRYFYSTPARGSLGGDLLAFAVALTFALATVLLRRRRQVQMLPAAALAAALTSAIASVAATPGAAGAGDLTLLALFGAGQLGLGMIMFTAGARRIPVAEASLIAVLESVLGPVWVWLALGENPGLPSLVGGAVVLAALAGHTLADLRLERVAPADAHRVAEPLVHRHLIGVGQRVGLAGHAHHREQLAPHRLAHAGPARDRGVGSDAVVAAVGRADREVDHLLGEGVEGARDHDLLDGLPGAAKRRRVVGERLPEVVDPVRLAGDHDVVVDRAHLGAGRPVLDQSGDRHGGDPFRPTPRGESGPARRAASRRCG